MNTYDVIAEFVDAETGERKAIGDTVQADEARARRLMEAGVIQAQDAPAAKRRTKAKAGDAE
ncbi:hypothetical protein GCM10025857_34200 [Alicyclobacillus contaminans]|uniref:hypothetical protein n=1 Tax=Alicyclobacillus contaminans TaxID=392016 RepID=UPI000423C634|nr:hypothetical protein [Alicyclobacillus contaminans]GMA52063.1 hypothetical protein GCM10025857_34200 [Alicyclobacillus contaminans]